MSEIIAMFVCIGLNGILSLTEMAFVSVGKNRIRDLAREGNRDALKLIQLRENPERTLSILQIGITFLGTVAAATGGVSIEEALNPHLENTLGLSEATAEVLGIILVVVPLTYISVVAGELVPKTLALRNPLRIALKSAKWLSLADKVFMPVVNLLEWSTKKLLSVFSSKSQLVTQEPDNSLDIDSLSHSHRQYVLNLVNIENKRIRDVYVPIKEVVCIQAEYTLDQVHHLFVEEAYTRLPVLRDSNVIGILHSKEFMALRAAGKTDWNLILRPAPIVNLNESLIKVLRMIQDGKSQMALVKQGDSFIGIVTLEDIIEEIIGDVFDEDEENAIKRLLSTGSSMRTPRGHN
jgi:putative hemolysin